MMAIPTDVAVPLVLDLLDLLAFEIDPTPTDEDAYVESERERLANEYTSEAHAAASAFIIDFATRRVVHTHGTVALVTYLDEMVQTFDLIARDEQDLACERRSLLAWRDCVDFGEPDLACRAALYSLGDSADYAEGLHAALDVVVSMLTSFADPNDPRHDPPFNAYDDMVEGVRVALNSA